MKYKVTFDTNIFVDNKNSATKKHDCLQYSIEDLFEARFENKKIELYSVSTTERESKNKGISIIEIKRNGYGVLQYGNALYGAAIYRKVHELLEMALIGISNIGGSCVVDVERKEKFLKIMDIICSNNEWRKWDISNLNNSQLRKYNDGLIFECHVYSGNDIFVSNDKKSYIQKESARSKLQSLFATEIYTPNEFGKLLTFP